MWYGRFAIFYVQLCCIYVDDCWWLTYYKPKRSTSPNQVTWTRTPSLEWCSVLYCTLYRNRGGKAHDKLHMNWTENQWLQVRRSNESTWVSIASCKARWRHCHGLERCFIERCWRFRKVSSDLDRLWNTIWKASDWLVRNVTVFLIYRILSLYTAHSGMFVNVSIKCK